MVAYVALMLTFTLAFYLLFLVRRDEEGYLYVLTGPLYRWRVRVTTLIYLYVALTVVFVLLHYWARWWYGK